MGRVRKFLKMVIAGGISLMTLIGCSSTNSNQVVVDESGIAFYGEGGNSFTLVNGTEYEIISVQIKDSDETKFTDNLLEDGETIKSKGEVEIRYGESTKEDAETEKDEAASTTETEKSDSKSDTAKTDAEDDTDATIEIKVGFKDEESPVTFKIEDPESIDGKAEITKTEDGKTELTYTDTESGKEKTVTGTESESDNSNSPSTKKSTDTSKKEDSKTDASDKKDTSKTDTSKTDASDKTSGTKSTDSGTKVSGTTAKSDSGSSATHTHNWVAQTKTVNHEAVTHQEQVLVEAAWDEPVYEDDIYVQCYCGAEFNTVGEWDAHAEANAVAGLKTCGGYRVLHRDVQTGTIHHDAVYTTQTVVDQAAYTETETTGYRCSGCGATK